MGESQLAVCLRAVDLLPAVGEVFQKHRDVVVGVLPRVAARPRAEQHHPFDAVAVESGRLPQIWFRAREFISWEALDKAAAHSRSLDPRILLDRALLILA